MSWDHSDFANPVAFTSDMDTEFFEYLRNFDADDLVNHLSHPTSSQNYPNSLGSSLTSELFSDLEESAPSNMKQEDISNYEQESNQLFYPSYELWSAHPPAVMRHSTDGQASENSLYSLRCNCLPPMDLNKATGSSQNLETTPPPESINNSKVVKRRRRRRKQGEPKSFVCTFEGCNNVYFRSSHLKVHVRKHTGEKPFRCTWPGCEWSFRRSDELSRHKRCHSGVKPYACIFCSKCFGRSDHLSKHMKVHQKSQSSLTIASDTPI